MFIHTWHPHSVDRFLTVSSQLKINRINPRSPRYEKSAPMHVCRLPGQDADWTPGSKPTFVIGTWSWKRETRCGNDVENSGEAATEAAVADSEGSTRESASAYCPRDICFTERRLQTAARCIWIDHLFWKRLSFGTT